MPEVYVNLAEGRTMDQKRALVKDITAAMVKNLGVDPEEALRGTNRRFEQRFRRGNTRPAIIVL